MLTLVADCNREMGDGEFQKHTSCISEAQKYEKTVWKGDKKGKGKNQQNQQLKQAAAATTNGAAAQPEAGTVPEPVKESEPAEKPAEPMQNGDKSAKKDKKDKKRKRDEAKAPAGEAKAETSAASAPAVETAPAPAAETSVNGEGKAKKRKKTAKEADSQQKGQQDPKTALEAALSAALSGDNASVALKEVLSKAGHNTDDLLAQLKVEKGKKGKFVLSFQ